MTKVQTIEAAKVMLAWAEGKEVEVRGLNGNNWVKMESPIWNWNAYEYRIKLEPKYRPFESVEEVMEAINEHGDWVMQGHDTYRRIDKVAIIGDNVCISFLGMNDWAAKELTKLGDFRFLDGTIFGKLVNK